MIATLPHRRALPNPSYCSNHLGIIGNRSETNLKTKHPPLPQHYKSMVYFPCMAWLSLNLGRLSPSYGELDPTTFRRKRSYLYPLVRQLSPWWQRKNPKGRFCQLDAPFLALLNTSSIGKTLDLKHKSPSMLQACLDRDCGACTSRKCRQHFHPCCNETTETLTCSKNRMTKEAQIHLYPNGVKQRQQYSYISQV